VNAKRPLGGSYERSRVAKRTVVIRGHKGSISLEDAFWSAFREIAANQKVSLSDLVTQIDDQRQHSNLSSAIRLFVLDHYRRMAELKRKEE
jgi:predicted DNA-binding ribbon-helix-helix protein